jgi:hypothetical protein
MLLKCQIHTKNQKKKKKEGSVIFANIYHPQKTAFFRTRKVNSLKNVISFQNPYSNIHISDPVKSISPK